MVRSLFDCLHAKYPAKPGEYILCDKGHKLGEGHVHIRQMERGDKLVYRICSTCSDFDDMNDKEIK